ncbi:hypothetical protein Hanom_Chr10g00881061 [Helianthus anomalus]
MTAAVAPKKSDTEKVQSSMVKNVGGEKKFMRNSSDSWCDYVIADIPLSNPDDPIDLESSPEHLVRNRAGKRKQSSAEAEGQPAKKIHKKKITKRGNLDAFISGSPLPVVNEELPPSLLRASAADPLKNTETPEGGVEKVASLGVDKPIDVAVDAKKITSPETVVDADNSRTPEAVAQDSEKENAAEEVPVPPSSPKPCDTMPENLEKFTAEE